MWGLFRNLLALQLKLRQKKLHDDEDLKRTAEVCCKLFMKISRTAQEFRAKLFSSGKNFLLSIYKFGVEYFRQRNVRDHMFYFAFLLIFTSQEIKNLAKANVSVARK